MSYYQVFVHPIKRVVKMSMNVLVFSIIVTKMGSVPIPKQRSTVNVTKVTKAMVLLVMISMNARRRIFVLNMPFVRIRMVRMIVFASRDSKMLKTVVLMWTNAETSVTRKLRKRSLYYMPLNSTKT